MKKILVSAGHTNNPKSDRGAVGNGYIEGVEAVKIRDAVAVLLRDRGYTVIEDGDDGVNEPLTKAVALAKTAQIAVEFHFNAAANSSATGVEVLSKPNERKLAQRIAKEISSALKIPFRGGDGGWKSDSSGQHHRLAFCEAGGLIAEVCFISNKNDMASYVANFGAMCLGIANAIDNGQSGQIEPPVVKDSLTTHTVQAGDTLWGLAVKYGLSVNALRTLNGIPQHVDRIDVGQVLRVKS